MNKHIVNVYRASDYAGASTDTHQFYYGYETAKCEVCGEKGESCNTHEDADNVWFFTVTEGGLGLFSKSSIELDIDDKFDVAEGLIRGMAVWGSRGSS
jgi:hypothetical protein